MKNTETITKKDIKTNVVIDVVSISLFVVALVVTVISI
jgi:hypothetical protein